nr:dynactin subunit 1-like [Aegilops tauschii subsp. strangulata]
MGKDKTAALEHAKKATAAAKGKKMSRGVIVEIRSAAWLDPGGLDSVHDPEGGSGGSGQRRLDRPRFMEAAGERDQTPTARGRIQPLQARDHPMWMYSSPNDTARVDPKEVSEETVEQWLRSITGNKDNPRGSSRVAPFSADNEPEKMYTMLNGEQFQEGAESEGESADWKSDDESDDDDDDSSSGEGVDSPPHSERRSKQTQDPAGGRGKVVASSAQVLKRTRTSTPEPTEKAPKQPKVAPTKTRKALPKIKVDVPVASAAATSATSTDAYKDRDDDETEDAATSKRLKMSLSFRMMMKICPRRPRKEDQNFGQEGACQQEDQVSAAKEAIRQASLMMEQMKVVREARQAAYDASSALQTNVQKSCELGAQFVDLEKKQVQLNLDLELAKENLQKAKDETAAKMKKALEKKGLDLAAAQKTAQEKSALAGKKLASVRKLEEDNAKMKTALDEANKQVTRLKKDKGALTDKVEDLTRKRNELEVCLGGLAKLFLILEEFCQNFEEETGRIQTSLDTINSPVKDEATMNVLRLESCLTSAMDYLA